jgi:hypothetical protein
LAFKLLNVDSHVTLRPGKPGKSERPESLERPEKFEVVREPYSGRKAVKIRRSARPAESARLLSEPDQILCSILAA